MKNNVLLRLGSISLALVMLLTAGCGTPAATKTAEKTPAPATTATAPDQPVKGGTLRIITNAGPQNLGYYPQMGPVDEAAGFPAVERILEYTLERELQPFLAKSLVEDPDKLTMTITLNEGIKFSDGTDLTAEVAAWNYQMGKDGKKLNMGNKIKSIEVKDKYTLVLNLTEWNNQMRQSFGFVPMYSKDAFEKNGGKDWALTHVVGTGPFKLVEFKRDVSLTWVRNDNYWQKDKGLPYLDGVEVRFIPDATTASALMKSGEADLWQNAEAKDQSEMKDKGFVLQNGWAAMQFHLMPNTVDPKSKWNDKRLRQALDYALDKPAIAKAIGYGIYQPLNQVAPPGEWGADPNHPIRAYDPAKAKQLLAEAGYPNGLKITLLAPMGTGGRNVGAEAVKGYLDAAGFQTDIDIADPGRFFGSVFGKGWSDLAFMFSGVDVNYLVSASWWWGPNPMTNLASFKRPQALIDLFNAAIMTKTVDEQKAATVKIVGEMTDEALMIPVYNARATIIMSPKVHTNYPKKGFARWDFENTWLDKK